MATASKKILVLILIVIASGAAYLAFGPAKEASETSGDNSLSSATADEMYISSLVSLEGRPVAMDKDKLVFLNVWATWCGPCNMEMPGIQKLYNKYKDHQKVAFYIVSDEDPETVNPFIERKGYALPFYQFTGIYPPLLNGNAIPRTYIIYKGKILAQEIGASQWDRPEIAEMIDKQLAEI